MKITIKTLFFIYAFGAIGVMNIIIYIYNITVNCITIDGITYGRSTAKKIAIKSCLLFDVLAIVFAVWLYWWLWHGILYFPA